MKLEHKYSEFLDSFRPSAENSRRRFQIAKSEALFGWSEISEHLSSELKCLEVGAGSGMLSAIAAQSGANIVAVEPVAAGFSDNEQILRRVEKHGSKTFILIRQGIESFEPNERYDFIWSINVFEHLDDWREGITKVYRLLNDGGKCLILCPNYFIPYEPHFSLPIIGGKSLTHSLFRNRIARHEKSRNAEGLWDSLNLITAGNVLSYCRSQNIQVSLDATVMRRIYRRFSSSDDIGKRHGWIGWLVKFFEKVGITRIVSSIPPRFQPYMAITIYKPGL